jgi:hypothetical protein
MPDCPGLPIGPLSPLRPAMPAGPGFPAGPSAPGSPFKPMKNNYLVTKFGYFNFLLYPLRQEGPSFQVVQVVLLCLIFLEHQTHPKIKT